MIRVIKPSFEIYKDKSGIEILRSIERYARTCYKSEDKITDISASRFVESLIKRGHESQLEHEKVTVKIICDRGVSHEIVRHRLVSFSQESTRYCNYNKKDIQFIEPFFFKDLSYNVWVDIVNKCSDAYNRLIELGSTPQEARSVLPNSLKTEIVITANLREWRHIFKLRCHTSAHPQMKEIMLPLLKEMYEYMPVIFKDIYQLYFELLIFIDLPPIKD